MTEQELLQMRDLAETGKVQFKERVTDRYDIGCEMVAFSNSRGGRLVIGMNDKSGKINALSYLELQETTNLLTSIASENVIPDVLIEVENVSISGGGAVIATIPEGRNKPYHDNRGVIWVKNGTSMPRNMFLFTNANYLLPYTGAGSGIRRALEYNPEVIFFNGVQNKEITHTANEFVITIPRKSNQDGADSNLVTDDNASATGENRGRSNQAEKTSNQPGKTSNQPGKASNQPRASLVTRRLSRKEEDIRNFCSVPRTAQEIMDRLGISNQSKNRQKYITSLMEIGVLERTIPEKPNDPNQKYRRKHNSG